MFPLLTTITFLPLVGGIALLFLPKERLSAIRWTALLSQVQNLCWP